MPTQQNRSLLGTWRLGEKFQNEAAWEPYAQGHREDQVDANG